MGNLTRAAYANQRMTLNVELRQSIVVKRNTMIALRGAIHVACFIIHVLQRAFGAKMKKDVAPYKTMRIKRQGSTEMMVLGSDHYIAPEVLAGQEATPAADVYGLGIMIFKLFTDEWADKK